MEILQLFDLVLSTLTQPLHLSTQRFPLFLKAVLQLLDLADQQTVVEGDQVEVLVAIDQVAETFGGEQHLYLGQGATLVEVAGPAREQHLFLYQLILCTQQIRGRCADLLVADGQLAVELAEQRFLVRGLLVEVVELVGLIVELRGERGHLRAEPLLFVTDLREALPALLDLCLQRLDGVLSCRGRRRREQQQGRDDMVGRAEHRFTHRSSGGVEARHHWPAFPEVPRSQRRPRPRSAAATVGRPANCRRRERRRRSGPGQAGHPPDR